MAIMLNELAELITVKYSPWCSCLYPVKFLGISLSDFKKKPRRDWTPAERVEIVRLIVELGKRELTGREKYYTNLLCSRVSETLREGKVKW